MNDLDNLRQEIDQIDRQLIKLLAKRFEVTAKVGHYKRANNLPIENVAREAAILEIIDKQATQLGLNIELLNQIYLIIFEYSKKLNGHKTK